MALANPSQPTTHVFGLWEETSVPRGNLQARGELANYGGEIRSPNPGSAAQIRPAFLFRSACANLQKKQYSNGP